MGRSVEGVGLGFRRELAADLLRKPSCVDFVEVVAEACLSRADTRREAIAVSELWPVVPHGVKLSLGSAEGIDPGRARALGRLARELRAELITEHVAFVRAGGREIGHLTPLPATHEALSALCRNVNRARRYLPDVPLLLENVACTLSWPEQVMTEPEFYTEVVQRTSCPLLLDISNLYANARNAHLDPVAHARAFPLENVSMIHLAGGVFEDGFYYDDHAHAVPEAVLELLSHVLGRVGDVPIVIERDAKFPPFSELEAELAMVRNITQSTETRPSDARLTPSATSTTDTVESQTLRDMQATLARLLTTNESSDAHGFDSASIVRTRAVLQRKRLSDAISLLPRLALQEDAITPLAQQVLARTPRAPQLAAVCDALNIAELAARDASTPALTRAARFDQLILRSRFVWDQNNGSVTPRQGPFVGSERSEHGATLWAIKGFGATAKVRVFERRAAF